MSILDQQLDTLRPLCHGPAGERLIAEMHYARRITQMKGGAFDDLLAAALAHALTQANELGAVTMPLVHAVEAMLSPMQAACKELQWLLIGHAHIDMNWLWSWEETVAITLSTFRSMLNLMAEHPHFTYAQSQASTYAIVEEYAPDMLEEIRARVAEGRWEVTASAWVEADRNLPSLESEMRHLLYTRRYLSRLLDIPEASMDLDFMPDTFGHNAKLPDILTAGGVKYMYHCRGEKNDTLYRWQGRTGRELLVFCDHAWYNIGISGDMAQHVASFCQHYGVPAMLSVYGVGDHGGGPTNKDLYRMEDMMSWPIFPTMRYGTYREFFTLMAAHKEGIPLRTGERNFIFDGCYTSQSRIKRGNALTERALQRSELFAALSRQQVGAPYSTARMEQAWRKVLFNHFHDILPGSGIPETREYALGEYQKVFAAARMHKQDALSALCSQIDTSAFRQWDLCPNEAQPQPSFAVDGVQAGPITRREGLRLYHLFNPLPYDREEVAEITVYDLPYDAAEAEFLDEQGNILPSQLLFRAWLIVGNKYLVRVKVPACGYTTIGMRRRTVGEPGPFGKTIADHRQEDPLDMVLENDHIRAEFDPRTGRLLRLIDKATGQIALHNASFQLVQEDGTKGMTSWRVGRTMSTQDVQGACYIKPGQGGDLRQSYEVTTAVGSQSQLRCTVSLDKGARRLRYQVSCDWRELGCETCIPQLRFGTMLPQAVPACEYAIPGGMVERQAAPRDVPSLHGMAAAGQALLCDCRYGFQGDGEGMYVDIVRSSADPDKVPEMGEISCVIEIGPLGEASLQQAIDSLVHPIEAVDMVYGLCHGGTQAATQSLLRVTGAQLTAVKMAEEGEDMVLHLINQQPEEAEAALTFALPIGAACRADFLEHPLPGACQVQGPTLTVLLPAHESAVLRVRLCRLE